MKKLLSYFIIALLAGAFTLGGYKTFFENKTADSVVKTIDTSEKATTVKTHFINAGKFAAETTDFTKAAAETVDAVVHVKNTAKYTTKDPFQQFFYGRSFEQVGTGSGVIISSDGYIITNNHVIANATEIEITLNNQKVFKAELIGTDEANDIALVKIEATNLPYVVFADSDKVKIGEWVLAVGNPYNLTSTVTAGIISAKGRDLDGNNNIESYLQTDAAVNPGNSGGALVNAGGELIGINTAISSKTGSYVGYSFAVPSNIAKKSIEDLIEYGNIQRAFLGIQFSELNNDLAKDLNTNTSEGIYLTRVIPKGAAAIAGLRKGDIIIKVNQFKVTKFSELKGQLSSHRPGDKISLTVLRRGTEKDFLVVLKNQFGNEVYSETEFIDNILGLKLLPLTKKQRKKNKLDYGVRIAEINNKEFSKFGVEKGAILLKINKKRLNSVKDVEQLLRSFQNEPYVILQILTTSGRLEYVSVKL